MRIKPIIKYAVLEEEFRIHRAMAGQVRMDNKDKIKITEKVDHITFRNTRGSFVLLWDKIK